MRICFLSSLHPPTDKRVFDKEAVWLASAGFDVVHVAPGPEGSIISSGVKILTAPSLRGIWGRILNGPRLYVRGRRVHADCYHCNEVDSWIVGVILKLTTGCKLVFDAHEAYPEDFADPRFPRFLRPAVKTGLRALFRLLLICTDRVVLAKESIAGDYPNPEKQVLVRNYVAASYANRIAGPRAESSSRNGLRIIHLGLISRKRGWPQLLASVAESELPFELVFVGQFNDGSESEFWKRTAELGLKDRIMAKEWMQFEDAFRLVCSSDVGVITFQPGIHNHVHALPHKMFDYMAAGLAVIAPIFALEVSRIIREADCGLLVDSSDPRSLREALEFLAQHPGERARMGRNGRDAVLHRYNWENEAARLEQMYREFIIGSARSNLRETPSGIAE
jgi:glycosyltransferase involved in cell wall biosynthesis